MNFNTPWRANLNNRGRGSPGRGRVWRGRSPVYRGMYIRPPMLPHRPPGPHSGYWDGFQPPIFPTNTNQCDPSWRFPGNNRPFSPQRGFIRGRTQQSSTFTITDRPPSPLPGSEEYIQRDISEKSALLKRELELDEQKNININSSQFDGVCSDFVNDSFRTNFYDNPFIRNAVATHVTKSLDDKFTENISTPPVRRSKRQIQSRKEQGLPNVKNVCAKILDHISNLSYDKIKNIVNQAGSSGYDIALEEISKQKRVELSKALRDMCNDKIKETINSTEVINSIIPDFDIKIQELPKEFVEQLSLTLNEDFEDIQAVNVDPEAMFQQAADMLNSISDPEIQTKNDLNENDFPSGHIGPKNNQIEFSNPGCNLQSPQMNVENVSAHLESPVNVNNHASASCSQLNFDIPFSTTVESRQLCTEHSSFQKEKNNSNENFNQNIVEDAKLPISKNIVPKTDCNSGTKITNTCLSLDLNRKYENFEESLPEKTDNTSLLRKSVNNVTILSDIRLPPLTPNANTAVKNQSDVLTEAAELEACLARSEANLSTLDFDKSKKISFTLTTMSKISHNSGSEENQIFHKSNVKGSKNKLRLQRSSIKRSNEIETKEIVKSNSITKDLITNDETKSDALQEQLSQISSQNLEKPTNLNVPNDTLLTLQILSNSFDKEANFRTKQSIKLVRSIDTKLTNTQICKTFSLNQNPNTTKGELDDKAIVTENEEKLSTEAGFTSLDNKTVANIQIDNSLLEHSTSKTPEQLTNERSRSMSIESERTNKFKLISPINSRSNSKSIEKEVTNFKIKKNKKSKHKYKSKLKRNGSKHYYPKYEQSYKYEETRSKKSGNDRKFGKHKRKFIPADEPEHQYPKYRSERGHSWHSKRYSPRREYQNYHLDYSYSKNYKHNSDVNDEILHYENQEDTFKKPCKRSPKKHKKSKTSSSDLDTESDSSSSSSSLSLSPKSDTKLKLTEVKPESRAHKKSLKERIQILCELQSTKQSESDNEHKETCEVKLEPACLKHKTIEQLNHLENCTNYSELNTLITTAPSKSSEELQEKGIQQTSRAAVNDSHKEKNNSTPETKEKNNSDCELKNTSHRLWKSPGEKKFMVERIRNNLTHVSKQLGLETTNYKRYSPEVIKETNILSILNPESNTLEKEHLQLGVLLSEKVKMHNAPKIDEWLTDTKMKINTKLQEISNKRMVTEQITKTRVAENMNVISPAKEDFPNSKILNDNILLEPIPKLSNENDLKCSNTSDDIIERNTNYECNTIDIKPSLAISTSNPSEVTLSTSKLEHKTSNNHHNRKSRSRSKTKDRELLHSAEVSSSSDTTSTKLKVSKATNHNNLNPKNTSSCSSKSTASTNKTADNIVEPTIPTSNKLIKKEKMLVTTYTQTSSKSSNTQKVDHKNSKTNSKNHKHHSSSSLSQKCKTEKPKVKSIDSCVQTITHLRNSSTQTNEKIHIQANIDEHKSKNDEFVQTDPIAIINFLEELAISVNLSETGNKSDRKILKAIRRKEIVQRMFDIDKEIDRLTKLRQALYNKFNFDNSDSESEGNKTKSNAKLIVNTSQNIEEFYNEKSNQQKRSNKKDSKNKNSRLRKAHPSINLRSESEIVSEHIKTEIVDEVNKNISEINPGGTDEKPLIIKNAQESESKNLKKNLPDTNQQIIELEEKSNENEFISNEHILIRNSKKEEKEDCPNIITTINEGSENNIILENISEHIRNTLKLDTIESPSPELLTKKLNRKLKSQTKKVTNNYVLHKTKEKKRQSKNSKSPKQIKEKSKSERVSPVLKRPSRSRKLKNSSKENREVKVDVKTNETAHKDKIQPTEYHKTDQSNILLKKTEEETSEKLFMEQDKPTEATIQVHVPVLEKQFSDHQHENLKDNDSPPLLGFKPEFIQKILVKEEHMNNEILDQNLELCVTEQPSHSNRKRKINHLSVAETHGIRSASEFGFVPEPFSDNDCDNGISPKKKKRSYPFSGVKSNYKSRKRKSISSESSHKSTPLNRKTEKETHLENKTVLSDSFVNVARYSILQLRRMRESIRQKRNSSTAHADKTLEFVNSCETETNEMKEKPAEREITVTPNWGLPNYSDLSTPDNTNSIAIPIKMENSDEVTGNERIAATENNFSQRTELPLNINVISNTKTNNENSKDLVKTEKIQSEDCVRQSPVEHSGNIDDHSFTDCEWLEVIDEDDDYQMDFKGFSGAILVIKVIASTALAASDKGKIFFYNMLNGDLIRTFDISKLAITSMCVIKKDNANILYAGSLDSSIGIINFDTKEILKYEKIAEPVQCMEYSWNCIFIGSDRGSLIRYELNTGKLQDITKVSDFNVLVIKATQEGPRKVLVIATRNKPVCVRDASSGLLLRTMESPFSPTVYTLLIDKNLVYCGTSQHDILVYTFEDGQLIFKHEATKSKGVVCMQIVGNLLFAGCYNGNIYVYNTKTNVHLGTMTGPGGLMLSMEIIHNKIIVGTKSSNFKAWRIPQKYLDQT